jgi:hypothetical protein
LETSAVIYLEPDLHQEDDLISTPFRKDLHLSAFQNFIPEIASLLREMTSFVREIASFVREIASFEREMTSFVREMASLLREMASFEREIASLLREMTTFVREIATFVHEIASPTGIFPKKRPFIVFFKYETNIYLPDLYLCTHPIQYQYNSFYLIINNKLFNH